MMRHKADEEDEAIKAQAEEEAEGEANSRRQRNFLLLARGAQNARETREREEQRQIEAERKAWDDTMAQIRWIRQQQMDQDFER